MIVKHSSMIQKRNINVKYTRICTQLLRKDMRFLICCTWWSSYSRGKPNNLVTKDKWDRSCRMMYWSIFSELEFVLEKEERERREYVVVCYYYLCKMRQSYGLSLEIDRKEEDISYHDLWSKGKPIHTKDSDEWKRNLFKRSFFNAVLMLNS